jgi:hypothetical protein
MKSHVPDGIGMCQTEHPLYAAGGTANVPAPSMATTAREDTWPIDGLCIYNYQLATQVDNRQVHPSLTEPNRKPGLRLAKHPKSLTDCPWFVLRTDPCGSHAGPDAKVL